MLSRSIDKEIFENEDNSQKPNVVNKTKNEKKGAFKDYLEKFSHIEDPLEKKRLALEEIDNGGFGWMQIKMIIIGGVGFLTDSYDIFAINIGITVLSYVYWYGDMPASTSSILKASTSVGTIIGQLGFGTFADIVGRKKVYGLELILMIVTAVLQCMIGASPAVNFVVILSILRVCMGIGIGGDYPLSSIISSEFSTTKWRGAIMAAVFLNQGLGQLFAGLVSMILVVCYKKSLQFANTGAECIGDCILACDQIWRLLIGFGCVPAVIALYYRLTISESPRYNLDITESHAFQKVADAEAVLDPKATCIAPPESSFKNFFHHFGKWRHGKILIGTSLSWFLLDIAYYGLNLNTSEILQIIGFASSTNVYEKLYNASAGNLILICAGSLPGYWATIPTIDIIGRKPIQLFGFIILFVLLLVIGFTYDHLSSQSLLALYVIAQFFQNFGPNTTTFIIPGEVFPTRYRSTAHGISAASGKVGAIIAQMFVGSLISHGCPEDNPKCFLSQLMKLFSIFMFLGIFTTLLLPETKRMTLEEVCEKYHGEIDTSKLIKNRYRTSTDSV